MELALLVYSVSLLDGILTFLTFASIVVALGLVASGIGCLEGYGDTEKPKLWFKRSLIALFIIVFVSTFIPNERTAYMMVAAYATQRIAETPEAKETGDKVLTLINGKLDQLILEANEPKKKSR